MRVRIIVRQGFTTLADNEIAWQGTPEQLLSFERSCNHTGEFRIWCSAPAMEENAGKSDKGAYDAAFQAATGEPAEGEETEERYPKFEGITQSGGLTRAARVIFRCDKGHLTIYENAPLPLVGGRCRTCNEWVRFPAEDQPNIVRTRKPEDARGDEFEQQ